MARGDWYRDMVFYRVRPDDVMRLPGGLDHVASLGATGVCLGPLPLACPPGCSDGDVREVGPEAAPGPEAASDGTDAGAVAAVSVIADARERGLRVLLDVPVDTTSDTHPWFLEALSDPSGRRHGCYVFRKGRRDRDGRRLPPDGRRSVLGGSAWEYVEPLDEYYLHVLGPDEPELNVGNPDVRDEVARMLRGWLVLGVDGFCLRCAGLADAAAARSDGLLPSLVSHGARRPPTRADMQGYLAYLGGDVIGGDSLVVGTAPKVEPRAALRYACSRKGPGPHPLDLVLRGSAPTEEREGRLRDLVRACSRWQEALAGKAWNALPIDCCGLAGGERHAAGRRGTQGLGTECDKMVATLLLFLQGTPFVLEGQELGSSDALLLRQGMGSPEELAGAVAAQDADLVSVLNFYRRAIRLRRFLPVVREGRYREFRRAGGRVFLYARESEWSRLLVMCSLSTASVTFRVPDEYGDLTQGLLALSNYYVPDAGADGSMRLSLRPYEARVYVFGRDRELVG